MIENYFLELFMLRFTNEPELAKALANVLGKSIRIILVLAIGIVLRNLFINMVTAFFKRKDTQQAYTLMGVLNKVIRYTINFFMFAAILELIGISIRPIITAAGVGSVALGFGAQTLVKDVINGLFILVEEQYAVGDIVELNGKTGKVEEINLRTTIVKNGGTNETYVIPNSEISIVTNKTVDYQKAVVNFEIPFDADKEVALGTVQDVLDKYYYVDKGMRAPVLHGITNFTDSGMTIRVSCDCFKGEAYIVERELRLQIKDALEAVGIEMPFPTQTILIEK